MKKSKIINADIVIIGAGIIGCALAWELSRYAIKVVVVEKEADIGWGTTKANSGILHAGYAGEPGTLKLSLCHKGNKLFRKHASQLDIAVKNTGSLVNALSVARAEELQSLYRQGKENGIARLSIIKGNHKIRELEPNIVNGVHLSLFAEDACIVSPYEAAVALYENAAANGCLFLFNYEVEKIKKGQWFLVFSSNSAIKAGCVINAAGLYADQIANMIGDYSFNIKGVKGEYLLLDNSVAHYAKRINFPITAGSKKKSKGILITPTAGGNILVGPTYSPCKKDDISTTREGFNEIRKKAGNYFRNIPFQKTIASFAGIRAVSDSNDFIISPSGVNPRFINIGGIQSPGLTCAFSISEMALELVKEAGISLAAKRDFMPERKSIIRLGQKDYLANRALWSANKNYGRIICRCEKITEAEVVEAVARGARTLDGVKFRTRAGMGRCQGGYCSLKVMHIIARELGIPPEEVTRKGKGSPIISGKVQ